MAFTDLSTRTPTVWMWNWGYVKTGSSNTEAKTHYITVSTPVVDASFVMNTSGNVTPVVVQLNYTYSPITDLVWDF